MQNTQKEYITVTYDQLAGVQACRSVPTHPNVVVPLRVPQHPHLSLTPHAPPQQPPVRRAIVDGFRILAAWILSTLVPGPGVAPGVPKPLAPHVTKY